MAKSIVRVQDWYGGGAHAVAEVLTLDSMIEWSIVVVHRLLMPTMVSRQ